ncbi:hypothetical protein HPB47_016140 [Ixodes persulcatus]|uniref:Uncharacterized protein n=1 Tax=Ixodes persulcatus TaxID=34615 RepID=A0AC60QRP2_IXOPE|nr:hypothetical protein HPB47_016140 [Ixodes persulcatus]
MANCFQLSSDVINWLPVLFGVAMFAWSYYAYVIAFCFGLVSTDLERIFYAVGFHLCLFMCLWAYVQTIITPIPVVPHYFQLNDTEHRMLNQTADFEAHKGFLEVLGQNRGILTRAADGSVRYCEACRLVKPDRCHHCSSCRKCVPKMDHHCPWFNNCVCFSTYKFFLLTLFYLVVTSVFVVGTTIGYVKHTWLNVGDRFAVTFHLTILVILGVVIPIFIGSFLYFHLMLVCKNETTLEGLRGPMFKNPGDSFNIGCYDNIVEVLGPNQLLWLVPVSTSVGDGTRFPTRLHPNRNVFGNPV